MGPPWSQRELGVVLRVNLPASAGGRGASLYYEPHAGGRGWVRVGLLDGGRLRARSRSIPAACLCYEPHAGDG